LDTIFYYFMHSLGGITSVMSEQKVEGNLVFKLKKESSWLFVVNIGSKL